MNLIDIHEEKYNILYKMFNFAVDITNIKLKLEFERIWINAHRAGEFIPLHQHSGLYSFVLWVRVPYYAKDQQVNCPNPMAIKDRTSSFEFVCIDHLGNIVNESLPVDKTWEGVMCVFPAKLHHQVYPFYNSDDIRISIAGNIRISKESFK